MRLDHIVLSVPHSAASDGAPRDSFFGSRVEGRPGGYGGVVIPVPIPNTEVKRSHADGTAVRRGRVGRRRAFSFSFPFAPRAPEPSPRPPGIRATAFLFFGNLLSELQTKERLRPALAESLSFDYDSKDRLWLKAATK